LSQKLKSVHFPGSHEVLVESQVNEIQNVRDVYKVNRQRDRSILAKLCSFSRNHKTLTTK